MGSKEFPKFGFDNRSKIILHALQKNYLFGVLFAALPFFIGLFILGTILAILQPLYITAALICLLFPDK